MQSVGEKLFKIVQGYGEGASFSSSVDSDGVQTDIITVPCRLVGKSTELRIVIEEYDFEIFIGDLLAVDKIEGQKLRVVDMADFVVDLLKAVQEGRAHIFEHTFLKRKAYSLHIEGPLLSNKGHVQFEELFKETLIKWLGKKTDLGLLEFEGA